MTELNPNIIWLALSKTPKLGPVSLRQLIAQYQSIAEVWDAVSVSLEQKEQLIKQAYSEYNVLQEKGINILNIHDSQYSSSLRENKEIAPLLYYKGHIEVLKSPMVAMVGSRNANDYGSDITKYLVQQLVTQGYGIASGLAIGIDTIAHQTALESGGQTIAILGCGIDQLENTSNNRLANKISDQGLLLSQFGLGIQPQRFTFPARNRLMAAISQAVVVTQASHKSGSLLTVQAAKEFGKPVFAVPGSIFNPGSHGTHQLIASGAYLAVDAAGIVKILDGQSLPVAAGVASQSQHLSLTVPEEHLLQLLTTGPQHTDQLIRASQFSAAEVVSTLSLLEMKSLVVASSNGEYRKA